MNTANLITPVTASVSLMFTAVADKECTVKEPEEMSDDDFFCDETQDETSENFLNNNISIYLSEIKDIPVMTLEEEMECGKKLKLGHMAEELLKNNENLTSVQIQMLNSLVKDGESAKEEFSVRNLKLVISIAKKYYRSNSHVELADLIAEGNVGLIKAIEKFDYEKGYRFSTYATWWIKQMIGRYVMDNSSNIRVPVHIREIEHKIKKTFVMFAEQEGRNPTNEELSQILGYPLEKIQFVLDSTQDILSLDKSYAKTASDEREYTLADILPDDKSLSPEKYAQNKELMRVLDEIMNGELSERERIIIMHRFGLGGCEVMTLQMLGEKFGITRERVRQIESRAMRQFRKPRNMRRLEGFL